LGGPDDAECQIDLNAQTWAVLAGSDKDRQGAAMRAVCEHLADEEHELIRLLHPPFNDSARDPGYIKAYPPGVRENGGQYNHAAAWAVKAAAETGDADLAYRWLSWLNPLTRSNSHDGSELYRIEPYVVAGDIYGCPPFAGRGGWSWYSGSAAWFYRVALENILGIRQRGNQISITPCVPESWSEYTVSLRHANAHYQLHIHQPAEICPGNVIFIEGDDTLAGSTLELQSDDFHEIHVYPDEVDSQTRRCKEGGYGQVIRSTRANSVEGSD
jgi:cyclic beta-1,2-glucan synthetase